MKMKSVKAVLIFLLLLAGVATGYLFWKMQAPDHEKEGILVENDITAYYNMAETGIPAFAAAPASVFTQEEEGRSKAL